MICLWVIEEKGVFCYCKQVDVTLNFVSLSFFHKKKTDCPLIYLLVATPKKKKIEVWYLFGIFNVVNEISWANLSLPCCTRDFQSFIEGKLYQWYQEGVKYPQLDKFNKSSKSSPEKPATERLEALGTVVIYTWRIIQTYKQHWRFFLSFVLKQFLFKYAVLLSCCLFTSKHECIMMPFIQAC